MGCEKNRLSILCYISKKKKQGNFAVGFSAKSDLFMAAMAYSLEDTGFFNPIACHRDSQMQLVFFGWKG
jgi:hypothetical protein